MTIRGLDARIALAQERLWLFIYGDEFDDQEHRFSSAHDMAEYLGTMDACTTPPIMFHDEPELLNRWHIGQQQAAYNEALRLEHLHCAHCRAKQEESDLCPWHC